MAAGFSPAEFWGLTPKLYIIHMNGLGLRLEREAKDAAWLAWHIAALGRVTKLPRLQQFIPGRKVAPKPKSWQGQSAAWKRYAARKKKQPATGPDDPKQGS